MLLQHLVSHKRGIKNALWRVLLLACLILASTYYERSLVHTLEYISYSSTSRTPTVLAISISSTS